MGSNLIFMFIVLFWAKNIVSITIHTPLSPLRYWFSNSDSLETKRKGESIIKMKLEEQSYDESNAYF